MNIINGKQTDTKYTKHFLDNLNNVLADTQKKPPLDVQIVLGAADTLSKNLDIREVCDAVSSFAICDQVAMNLAAQAKQYLSREYLETKLKRELGENPFEFRQTDHNIREKYQPLGVLTHIAAGNAAGLPAFSVLEGLLCGNINLLKLPGNDDGLSTTLLEKLIKAEPRLGEYIYVFDLPSTDADAIRKMLSASDAVAVWGSDFAVSGIRAISPPNIQIIEWGHKLSFAYVTKSGEESKALDAIAKDICESEQLLCSSPQCVYYETDSFNDLVCFAERLYSALEKANAIYPMQTLDQNMQAEITSLITLKSIEELVDNKKVLRGNGFSVIADADAALCASPGFRNVWVKPMRKDAFLDNLRKHKGYLQTVGLACAKDELDELTKILYACGVCRITPCGSMSAGYAGEPHDGYAALSRYVKTVTLRV